MDQVESWPATIEYIISIKLLQISFPLPDLLYSKLYDSLKNRFMENAICNYKHKNQTVLVIFKDGDDVINKYGKLKALIGEIQSEQQEVLPCVYCHEQGGDVLVFNGNSYCISHSHCHTNCINSMEKFLVLILGLIT